MTKKNTSLFARTPKWLLASGINSLLAILTCGGIYLIIYLLNMAGSISVPLILAFVIGIISYPLVKFADKYKVPRAASATLVILFVIIIGYGAVQVTATGIVKQIPDIGGQLVSGVQNLGKGVTNILVKNGVEQERIDSIVAHATSAITSYVKNLQNAEETPTESAPQESQATPTTKKGSTGLMGSINGILGGLTSVFKTGVTTLGGVLSSLVNVLFGLFIGAILLFYFLTDYENIVSWIGAHLGVDPVLGAGLVEDASSSLRDYFKGTTITGLVVAVVIGVSMALLGVPLAIPIALVTFVTCYIPFFGAIIASAFACLIALGSGGITTALIALLIVIVVQNLLQSVINAKFLSNSLDIHPMVVLAITMVGSTFAGLMGAMLAAPFLAMFLRGMTRLKKVQDDEGNPIPELP